MSSIYPNFDSSKFDKEQIYQANQFHSINGLILSNPSDLILKRSVNWHLLGWGTYWDVQYVKWQHGKVVWSGTTVDHIRLMPASFYTVTVNFDTNGKYQFGSLDMVMQYTVTGE